MSQINQAMSQLDQATQQNASSSEEPAATAEEFSAQAEQLQQAVSFFSIDTTNASQFNHQPARAVVGAIKQPPGRLTSLKLLPPTTTSKSSKGGLP